MTVADMIDRLKKLPNTAPVKAWDADSEDYRDVTGFVWDDDGSVVFVQTDDIS